MHISVGLPQTEGVARRQFIVYLLVAANCHSLFTLSSAPYVVVAPRGVPTPFGEHMGFTKFYIVNNYERLRSHL